MKQIPCCIAEGVGEENTQNQWATLTLTHSSTYTLCCTAQACTTFKDNSPLQKICLEGLHKSLKNHGQLCLWVIPVPRHSAVQPRVGFSKFRDKSSLHKLCFKGLPDKAMGRCLEGWHVWLWHWNGHGECSNTFYKVVKGTPSFPSRTQNNIYLSKLISY